MTRARAPQLALPVPLINVLPEFAAELAEALQFEDVADLADQVRELSVTARVRRRLLRQLLHRPST